WELDPDGSWRRRSGGERSVHGELRERALERAAAAEAAEVPSESAAGTAQGAR
ncbi:MAG: hypothetical protein QOF65_2657, partial [Thermoleophilaceae bacterium]|nr:hypothetical protein [Thermoleophilaceae bacterium]